MKLTMPSMLVGHEAVEHLWELVKIVDNRSYGLSYRNKICVVDLEEKNDVYIHFANHDFMSTFNSFNSYMVMETMKSLWLTFVRSDSVFRKKYWKLFSTLDERNYLLEDFDDLNGFRSFFRSFISVDKGYNFPVMRFIFSNGDEFHVARVEEEKGMFSLCCLNFSILLRKNECNGSPLSKKAFLEKEKHNVTGAVILVKLDDFPYGRKKWRQGKIFVELKEREKFVQFFKSKSLILFDEQPAMGGSIYTFYLIDQIVPELKELFPWFEHSIVKQ